MKKIDFKPHLRTRGYKAIEKTKGGLELSIFAGDRYYSLPRETIPNPSGYTDVELAIFLDGKWASAAELKRRGVFEVVGMGEFQSEENTSNEAWVFPYISIAKIHELIEKC